MNVNTVPRTAASQMMLQGLEDSVNRHMPRTPYRDFYLWALSDANPVQELWWHLLGVPQFENLTLGLLRDVVPDYAFHRLLQYSVPMNLYLIFEVASDDLAIGLSDKTKWEAQNYQRRTLLMAFNRAMIERLKGHDDLAGRLLDDVQELSRQISGFEQSLIPDKHNILAATYLEKHPGISLDDLEYALWPRLAMNIETCVAAAQTVQLLRTGNIVTQGLISRYRGVSRLLQGESLALSERVHIGVDTILVVPTLAYYIGAIAEDVFPLENFRQVVDSGELTEALFHAALAVRLLNDMGTSLLTRADLRTELCKVLRSKQREGQKFSELVLDSSDQIGPDLARLKKDIDHGEFNVCLYDLDEMPVSEAIDSFEWRLTALSIMYSQAKYHIDVRSESITRRVSNEVISVLINRFVDFHAKLYLNPYDHPTGDYTVGV